MGVMGWTPSTVSVCQDGGVEQPSKGGVHRGYHDRLGHRAYQHTPGLEQRLSQAGVRIAAYLNQLLGS